MFTILTTKGRAAIAEAVKDFSLFMAFGSGQPEWDTTKEVIGTFGSNSGTINVGYQEIDNVHVYPPDPGEPISEYALGADYSVNKGTGIITRNSGGSIPVGSVRVGFYVKPATPSLSAITLVNELGRKEIFNKQFVVANTQGEIIVPGGRYSLSNVPTPYLFLSCTLLEPELSTALIKEIGVYVNPTFFVNPINGEALFAPDEFSDLGKLMTLRHYTAIQRNEGARETFQYVIPL